MTYRLILRHGGAHIFDRPTFFEIAQLVDNYSRDLPSGPWLPRKCGEDEWLVERIDCKCVGHVRKLQQGEQRDADIRPV